MVLLAVADGSTALLYYAEQADHKAKGSILLPKDSQLAIKSVVDSAAAAKGFPHNFGLQTADGRTTVLAGDCRQVSLAPHNYLHPPAARTSGFAHPSFARCAPDGCLLAGCPGR